MDQHTNAVLPGGEPIVSVAGAVPQRRHAIAMSSPIFAALPAGAHCCRRQRLDRSNGRDCPGVRR